MTKTSPWCGAEGMPGCEPGLCHRVGLAELLFSLLRTSHLKQTPRVPVGERGVEATGCFAHGWGTSTLVGSQQLCLAPARSSPFSRPSGIPSSPSPAQGRRWGSWGSAASELHPVKRCEKLDPVSRKQSGCLVDFHRNWAGLRSIVIFSR